MITLTKFKRKIMVWGLPFLVFQALPVNAFAFSRSQSDTKGVYLYLKNRNVSFTLNDKCYTGKDATLETCKEAVNKSISEWTQTSCSDLKLVLGGETSDTEVRMDNENLIVWRGSADPKDTDNYWKWGSGVIALTTTSYNTVTGEIYDSDIEVNALDYTFSALEVCPSDEMDIQNTLTHEIGHTIGLGHSNVESAVMAETAEKAEMTKRDLSDDDIKGVCTIYPTGEKTPLTVDQSRIAGGCMTNTIGSSDIPALAFFALLLWFLRVSFRRADLG